MSYVCPACGYNQLETKPYKNMVDVVKAQALKPPYYESLGEASYDVCDCCGFEFGQDDNPGTGAEPISFAKHREQWIAEGCSWFDPELKPEGWSVEAQLKAAGLSRTK